MFSRIFQDIPKIPQKIVHRNQISTQGQEQYEKFFQRRKREELLTSTAMTSYTPFCSRFLTV